MATRAGPNPKFLGAVYCSCRGTLSLITLPVRFTAYRQTPERKVIFMKKVVIALSFAFVLAATAAQAKLTITNNNSDDGFISVIRSKRDNFALILTQTAIVKNEVENEAESGGDNIFVGEDADITHETGAATAETTLGADINSAVIDLTGCGCNGAEEEVLVDGNNSDDGAIVVVDDTRTQDYVEATSFEDVKNGVEASSETGDSNYFVGDDAQMVLKNGVSMSKLSQILSVGYFELKR